MEHEVISEWFHYADMDLESAEFYIQYINNCPFSLTAI